MIVRIEEIINELVYIKESDSNIVGNSIALGDICFIISYAYLLLGFIHSNIKIPEERKRHYTSNASVGRVFMDRDCQKVVELYNELSNIAKTSTVW